MKKIAMLMLITFSQYNLVYAKSADTTGVVFTPIQSVKVPQKKPLAVFQKPMLSSEKSLWSVFAAGFAGGLLAFFMPCVFPLLPMTIAYFTKGTGNKRSAIGKAIIYGVSIILIYVVLGLIITVLFGPSTLNSLSTSAVFNLFFFGLLVIFAASFLGAFELILPSKWVNAADTLSEKTGVLGLFFMAATLALVSFSCTGPIIGTLLVQAATEGAVLGPVIGMFGYSLALAMPFTLFAMFPAWLKSMPKSGGWLNSIKVMLGFLELALALKFLSNVDLAYHWHLFDREVFLVIWIVIAGLTGFYLLGKLRFAHDADLKYITVPRLFLAIVVFAFSVYLVPGLWGAPLKSVSAFLPPMTTQDFDLSAAKITVSESNPIVHRKYAELFDKPKGFDPFFDYDEALAYAKKVNKPVMIDFTGHACVNCRKMEADVWTDSEVGKVIRENYVLVQLYVDDKTDLPAVAQTVTSNGTTIKTLGNKWSYLQTSRFGSNAQPFYVLVNPKTEQLLTNPEGAEYNARTYLQFLRKGLENN